MTRLNLGMLWDAYSKGGQTVSEIAKHFGVSFGKLQAFLAQHPDYAEVARKRQRDAAARARIEAKKSIDDDRALSMLRSGAPTRTVAAAFGVSTRTLRKRLQPYPDYAAIMRGRRRPPRA